ncbi:hypothetical protein BGW80DRAFT_1256757 [Lactifluus volemus]|nr:hypothetical protein BGW80DRAFT_1256757 [Lactifluus volemus]
MAGGDHNSVRILRDCLFKLERLACPCGRLSNYHVARDEDGYTSSSSGFSIDSCTKEEMYSFDKTERYALVMSDAVISLPVFISFLKGHASLVERAGGTGSSEPRPFNARGFRLVYLSEDM